MDKKTKVLINSDLFLRLGIKPGEGVKYLENKDAADMSPVHVKAHQILKQEPVRSS